MLTRKRIFLSLGVIFFLILLVFGINYFSPQKRLHRYYSRGMIHSQKKDYLKAISEFKAALQIDSSSAEIHLALANAYLKSELIPEAIKAFQRVLALEKNRKKACLSLGIIYMSQKNYQKALQLWNIFLEESSDDKDILNQKGMTLLSMRQKFQAESTFRYAIEKHPTDGRAYLHLARIHWRENRKEKAISLLLQYLKINPLAYRARFQLGRFYMVSQRSQEAVEEFRELLGRHPEQISSLAPNLVLVLIDLGKIQEAANVAKKTLSQKWAQRNRNPLLFYARGLGYLQEKKFSLAVSDLQWARRFIQNLDLKYQLAVGYSKTGQNILAIRELEAVIKQNPQFTRAYPLLFQLLLLEKQARRAEELILKALPLMPSQTVLYRFLGQVYLELEEIHKAKKTFHQLIKLTPQSLEGKIGLVIVEMHEKNYPQAIDKLSMLLEKHPNNLHLNYLLAQNYLQERKLAQVLFSIEQCLKISPGFLPAKILRAEVRLLQNTPALAIQEYKSLLEELPHNLKIRLELVRLYLQIHQPEKARALIDKVKSLSGNNPDLLPYLAQIALQEKQPQKALEFLDQIPHPKAETLALKGSIHLQKRNGQEAANAYLRASSISESTSLYFRAAISFYAQGKWQEALLSLKKHLSKDSTQAGHILQAMIYSQQQQDEKALKTLDSLSLESSKSPSLLFLARANIYTSQQKYKQALDEIAQISEEHKDLRNAFTLVVQSCEKRGVVFNSYWEAFYFYQTSHFYMALEKLEAAERDFLEDPFLLYLKATIWQALSEEKKAREILLALIKTGNAPSLTYTRLAKIFAKSGKFQEAIELLTPILNSSSSPDIWVTLAICYRSTDQTKDATLCYEKALAQIKNNPKHPLYTQTCTSLAQLLAKESSEKAYLYAEKAYNISPNQPEVLDILGVILAQEEKYSLAQEHLEFAHLLAPHKGTISYHLAKVYFKQKQIKKGKEILQKALALGENFPEYKEALRLMEENNG